MAILDPTALQRDLAGVVAECRPANSADPAIDGVRPAIVCRPGTPAEVAAVLAVADRHRAAVIPVGGGTKTGLGNPPRAAEILLRLDGLRQVGDFSPADLTAGCQAGLRWAEFQQHLAAAGQFVPLDPPFADRATVGGVLATNSFGPSRIGQGTARDYLIGITVANPDGTLTKAGGKVVKNVAGYDLNKLYIGSLGTLGVIVKTVWKLAPVPPVSAGLLIGLADPGAAGSIARRIVRTGLQPRAAQVIDGAALARLTGDPGRAAAAWWLAVRFAGRPERVRRQIRDARAIAEAAGPVEITEFADTADANLWAAIGAWPESRGGPGAVRVKIAVRPTDLGRMAGALVDGPAGVPGVSIFAQAAIGVLHVAIEPDGSPDGTLAERLAAWRAIAAERGGSLVIESAPLAVKHAIDAWGDPGPGRAIMHRLKDNLDPNHILNPGRYVAGI